MAMMITDQCILCDACLPVCPNEAISRVDIAIYIDPERCAECVGAFDEKQCVAYCPVPEAIVTDPANTETVEHLAAKAEALKNAAPPEPAERPRRPRRKRAHRG